MNCKKIQELILTDYIDGEADMNDKRSVDDHLMTCVECKKFLTSVQSTAKIPFVAAEKLAPPDRLWHNIKDAIIEKGTGSPVRTGILESLGSIIRIPRPVMALACLVLIMFIIGALAGTKMYRPLDKQEKDFLDYSVETLSDDKLGETVAFGTSIEEYFL